MKRLMVWFTMGLVVLTLASGCDPNFNGTQVPVGTIVGRVIENSTHAPVVNAQVHTRPASQSMFTDSNGAFTITNVQEGTHEVTVHAGDRVGYVMVNVVGGRQAQANVQLKRQSPYLTIQRWR